MSVARVGGVLGDESILAYYKTIGDIQSCIANSTTLDEALQGGLRIIVENSGAQSAVMWYADKAGDGSLHPYYWIGPIDLTSKSHAPGEGSVGEVFQTQKADRRFDFKANCDLQTALDFEGMDVNTMVCVPFSNNFEDLGVIQFVNKEDGTPFTEEGADIMEIMAMMAAIAVGDNEALQAPWTPGEVVMSLRDITREFQNGDVVTKVLKGVNLDVYEGEFLVLLGESGCGKSTLLNIIGAWTRPRAAASTTWARTSATRRRIS